MNYEAALEELVVDCQRVPKAFWPSTRKKILELASEAHDNPKAVQTDHAREFLQAAWDKHKSPKPFPGGQGEVPRRA